jgi:hypothetical protein
VHASHAARSRSSTRGVSPNPLPVAAHLAGPTHQQLQQQLLHHNAVVQAAQASNIAGTSTARGTPHMQSHGRSAAAAVTSPSHIVQQHFTSGMSSPTWQQLPLQSHALPLHSKSAVSGFSSVPSSYAGMVLENADAGSGSRSRSRSADVGVVDGGADDEDDDEVSDFGESQDESSSPRSRRRQHERGDGHYTEERVQSPHYFHAHISRGTEHRLHTLATIHAE